MKSRGLRNNNPGNLRHSANGKLLKPFTGEIRPITDKSFRSFYEIEDGYRAMFVQLLAYLKRGQNTISKIISIYAPPSENDTEAYIKTVEKQTGLNRNAIIKSADKSQLANLMAAISQHENGVAANKKEIQDGIDRYTKQPAHKQGSELMQHISNITIIAALLYAGIWIESK